MMSAVELDLPIAVLVLDNNALGWVLHGSGRHPVGARSQAFDSAAMVRAMDCDAVRVASEADLSAAVARIARLETNPP